MKALYYTASSLDGFIADEQDSLDWLFQFGDVGTTDYPDFIRTVGAAVMGSGTYESMAQMLPGWVPARSFLVHLTGVLEFAIAFGFLLPQSRRMTGWIAAIVLVLFFPVNIHAAIHHVPFGGHAWGPVYLLIRAPLQFIILFWIYWFTLRRSARGNGGLPHHAQSGNH